MIFDDREYEVLKKHKKGSYVDEADEYWVEKLSCEGLIVCGISDEYRPTAKLTDRGKRFLRRDHIFRNPFLCALYRLKAMTF